MSENLNVLCDEITSELKMGFEWKPERPVIAIYGSARLTPDSMAYKQAYELSYKLGQNGWSVVTGGGPGIMEAGNKGALEAGAESIGLNIRLPHEQATNGKQTVELHFNHFTSRKAVFVRRTDIFVAFEGGFGTLDEIFDTVTQIQTKKRTHSRIVLVGKEFWSGLVEWIEKMLLKNKLINPEDPALFVVVNTVDEAYEALTDIWNEMGCQPAEYKEVA